MTFKSDIELTLVIINVYSRHFVRIIFVTLICWAAMMSVQ